MGMLRLLINFKNMSGKILQLEESLMTFEEYAEKEHDTPYVFETEHGNKKITYFGAAHSANLESPMFEQIREKFDEIKPQMVFVEGITNLKNRKQEIIEWLRSINEAEAIRQMGETGFISKLAIKTGTNFDSPEPNPKEEIKSLENHGFSREEIFAYYAYRQQVHYFRVKEEDRNIPVEEYLSKYIQNFQKNTNWKNFNYSFNHLKEIGKKIWGEQGDIKKNYHSRVNPVPSEVKRRNWRRVNEVAQQSSYFRDKYIIHRIEETMKKYDRLFIVYGASHAVMQEPALRRMLENK